MRKPASIAYLRFVIGVFFVAIGVFAIVGLQHDMVVVGQDIAGVRIAFGIVEVLGGLSLVFGVFTSFRFAPVHVVNVILFWVWTLKIVLNILSLAVPSFPSDSGIVLDGAGWIVSFTLQLMVLSAFYLVNRDYDLL
jgi:hypothetical protein